MNIEQLVCSSALVINEYLAAWLPQQELSPEGRIILVGENKNMPITEELQNLKKFESVGFSHDQSETLADVIEQSHAQSQESLKDFIRNEIKGLRNELRADIANSSKDLLVKIFAIIFGTSAMLFAMIKLGAAVGFEPTISRL